MSQNKGPSFLANPQSFMTSIAPIRDIPSARSQKEGISQDTYSTFACCTVRCRAVPAELKRNQYRILFCTAFRSGNSFLSSRGLTRVLEPDDCLIWIFPSGKYLKKARRKKGNLFGKKGKRKENLILGPTTSLSRGFS